MRTKNFFKGLAVAALVGVFATSCSEEELNVNGTINGPQVDPYTPTELPDGVAYAAISVVDLGDLGLGSKVLVTEMKDVTGMGETAIECPDFEGMDAYIIPAAQTINVPTVGKAQTLTIPVTFYVVKTESAFAQVEWDVDDAKDWGWNEEGNPYVYESETILGTKEAKLQNLSNYWKDVKVKYSVPLAYFAGVEDATKHESTEDEGTEDEGTEDEGTEGEGTEGEEAAALYTIDYSTVEAYPFYDLGAPEGASFAVENGVLVIENTVEGANAWDLQPMIADQFSVQEGYTYTVKISMKASADGAIQLAFGGWEAGNMYGALEFAASEDFETYEVVFANSTIASANNDIHVLWQGAKFVGTVEIAKVEIYEAAPATEARAAATTAEEIIAAYVKNIVMPEYGEEAGSYNMTTESVCLFSGACVDFTKTIYCTHPTYEFEYMGEKVEVTFEQIVGAFGTLSKPYAIPGHETEYSHSAGHGHYEHDIHGNHLNAGGGIVSFE